MIKPTNHATQNPLLRLLAGQHSQFFRTDVFYATRDLLVRAVTSVKHSGTARIALVGGAAGEEPYSLLMALDRAGQLARVNFTAVDSDPQMVIRAARGAYAFADYGGRHGLLGSLPDGYSKYFRADETAEVFTVDPKIKKAVCLKVADAEAGDFGQRVAKQDVIIINNVLVHVADAARQARIVDNLVDRLDAGGRLIANERLDHPRLAFKERSGSVYCYSLLE